MQVALARTGETEQSAPINTAKNPTPIESDKPNVWDYFEEGFESQTKAEWVCRTPGWIPLALVVGIISGISGFFVGLANGIFRFQEPTWRSCTKYNEH